MRPLPRLLAVTNDAITQRDDFGIRVAAIAAAGSSIGIVARAPGLPPRAQLAALDRVVALTRPPMAAALAHGDPALGRLAGAAGVQLRAADLPVPAARRALGHGWVGVSVHSLEEARAAAGEGADFLVVGNVFDTTSHPERPGKGTKWLESVIAGVAVPVFAIGGITPERAPEVRDTGAWGMAAISALFAVEDSAKAAMDLLSVWSERE